MGPVWGQAVIAFESESQPEKLPCFPGEAGHGPTTLEHKRF